MMLRKHPHACHQPPAVCTTGCVVNVGGLWVERPPHLLHFAPLTWQLHVRVDGACCCLPLVLQAAPRHGS